MDEVLEEVHEGLPALRPDGLIGLNPPIESAPAYPEFEEAVRRVPEQPVSPGAFEASQLAASQPQVMLGILVEAVSAEPQAVALDDPPLLPVESARGQVDGFPLQVWFVSLSHSDEDIDKTLEAVHAAFKESKKVVYS